mmetsp:Transcript_26157/g.68827  ORF Transcript_26157/g.68827 Transcript_26157/m.68827 type:complete len:240 (-) Transcript_26157:491-1210(-)
MVLAPQHNMRLEHKTWHLAQRTSHLLRPDNIKTAVVTKEPARHTPHSVVPIAPGTHCTVPFEARNQLSQQSPRVLHNVWLLHLNLVHLAHDAPQGMHTLVDPVRNAILDIQGSAKVHLHSEHRAARGPGWSSEETEFHLTIQETLQLGVRLSSTHGALELSFAKSLQGVRHARYKLDILLHIPHRLPNFVHNSLSTVSNVVDEPTFRKESRNETQFGLDKSFQSEFKIRRDAGDWPTHV